MVRPKPPPANAAGSGPAGGPRRDVPVTVTAAAALAGLEAAGLVGYAATYTFQVLPLGNDAVTRALIAGGVVVFLLTAAAAVATAAWALLNLRHWPRSLLVVTQLLAIAVITPLAMAGSWVAWLAVAVAVAVASFVVAPPTTKAIER